MFRPDDPVRMAIDKSASTVSAAPCLGAEAFSAFLAFVFFIFFGFSATSSSSSWTAASVHMERSTIKLVRHRHASSPKQRYKPCQELISYVPVDPPRSIWDTVSPHCGTSVDNRAGVKAILGLGGSQEASAEVAIAATNSKSEFHDKRLIISNLSGC